MIKKSLAKPLFALAIAAALTAGILTSFSQQAEAANCPGRRGPCTFSHIIQTAQKSFCCVFGCPDGSELLGPCFKTP